MTRLELSIAWRYMKSRRGSRLVSLISVIAVSGVIVGVSALIVIIGVMNGMQTDLRDKILVADPDIRITPYGDNIILSDSAWHKAIDRVRKDPGVVAASPFVTTLAMASSGHAYLHLAFILGIVPGGELHGALPATDIRTKAIEGDFSFKTADGQYNGAVVGEALASALSLTPGIDTVTLVSARADLVDPVTGNPRFTERRYPVTGVFRTGLYEYDNSYVMLSLEAAQQLSQLGAAVTGLEVRTPSRNAAPAIAERLADSLSPGLNVQDWHAQNVSLFKALALEKYAMAFILLLIVLVAAFNIVGTLTMVVADKTREIGILRAMGMTSKAIERVFFAQGMFIGVAGTGIGLTLGLIISVVIDRFKLIPLEESVYFIDHLPVQTQPFDVAVIVLASMAIAAVATLYPARLASRLLPVEAIRHE